MLRTLFVMNGSSCVAIEPWEAESQSRSFQWLYGNALVLADSEDEARTLYLFYREGVAAKSRCNYGDLMITAIGRELVPLKRLYGKMLGSKRSEKKAAAVRVNGRKSTEGPKKREGRKNESKGDDISV